MNVIYCVLGITSNTCCIESFQDVSKKCQVLFKEKGWTGITADPSLLELANMFLDFCQKMQMKNPDSVYNDVLSVISEKSNHRFNTIKQFQSREAFKKKIIKSVDFFHTRGGGFLNIVLHIRGKHWQKKPSGVITEGKGWSHCCPTNQIKTGYN